MMSHNINLHQHFLNILIYNTPLVYTKKVELQIAMNSTSNVILMIFFMIYTYRTILLQNSNNITTLNTCYKKRIINKIIFHQKNIYINAYKKNTEHVSNVWQIVDDLLYDIYNLLCVIYANYM